MSIEYNVYMFQGILDNLTAFFRRNKSTKPRSTNSTHSNTTQTPMPTATPTPQPVAPKIVAGPSYSGIIDAGQSWGAWIQLQQPGQIGVHVRWQNGKSVPILHFLDEQGIPRIPARTVDLHAQQMWIGLPIGSTYLMVQNSDPAPQPIRVSTQIPMIIKPIPGM